MKKIFTTISILAIPMMLSAKDLTQLEGSFKVGPAIILIAMLASFVLVGFLSRAKDTTDYYAAGRKISNISSGMAIGSNWMSAASFLGMAGMMYATGYNGLAYVVGWTGGYVLLLILMAGQIRKYGKFTAGDFIGDRYYSQTLRGISAVFTILISFAYCVGQFGGVGLMFKWILGINYTWAVIIGASVVIGYTMLSGMIGATKNMVIQYIILILAFLIPTFLLTYKFDYFWLLPQFGYGAIVSDIVRVFLHQIFLMVWRCLMHTDIMFPWSRAPNLPCPGILRPEVQHSSGWQYASRLCLVQQVCLMYYSVSILLRQ